MLFPLLDGSFLFANFSCNIVFSREILLTSLVCIRLCHLVIKNAPKVTKPDNTHPKILFILDIFNNFSIKLTISPAGNLRAKIINIKIIPITGSCPLFADAISTFCKNPQKLGLCGLCLVLLFLRDKLIKWLVVI